MENLKFKDNNPGAVQYGNFINYYNFHPPKSRIESLPTDIWRKGDNETCVCLDIGCNAGELTLALQKFLEEHTNKRSFILGVDIDAILIERATEKIIDDRVKFQCLNIMDKEKFPIILDYLQEKQIYKFNVVFCFSITMWIHLNHGDEGLTKFLKNVSEIAEILVIEPQPWKCYKTAEKRLKKSDVKFPYFEGLSLRNNVDVDIENFLTEKCGRLKIHESVETNRNRKILIFS